MTSSAFDGSAMAEMAVEVVGELTRLVQGDVLVLVPGLATALETRKLLQESGADAAP